MSYRRLKAVVNEDAKDKLIAALEAAQVPGFNFHKVKGQGELCFGEDSRLVKSYSFEIYINTAAIDPLIRLIVEAVQTGELGDGLIAISPVEEVIRIRDCSSKKFSKSDLNLEN